MYIIFIINFLFISISFGTNISILIILEINYYDYQNYGYGTKKFTIRAFLVESATNLKNMLSKWIKSILNRLKR